MKNYQVYFVRHNFLQFMEQKDGETAGDFEKRRASRENFAQKMYEERRIAYGHYPLSHQECLSESATPELAADKDFKKAHSAAKMFEEMYRNVDDVLVAAEYELYEADDNGVYRKNKRLLLGKLKNEKVEDYKDYRFPMKTLSFDDAKVKELRIEDYPVYLAVRPPFGTVCCPSSAFFTDCLPAVYEGEPIKLDKKLLHSSMLEQLCEEYLRRVGFGGEKMTHSICKVGHSMSVFDIVGRAEKGKIFYAQVKSDKEDDTASSYFAKYKNDEQHCYLFFDDCIQTSDYRISTDEVFEYFKQNDIQVLCDMIGFC